MQEATTNKKPAIMTTQNIITSDGRTVEETEFTGTSFFWQVFLISAVDSHDHGREFGFEVDLPQVVLEQNAKSFLQAMLTEFETDRDINLRMILRLLIW